MAIPPNYKWLGILAKYVMNRKTRGILLGGLEKKFGELEKILEERDEKGKFIYKTQTPEAEIIVPCLDEESVVFYLLQIRYPKVWAEFGYKEGLLKKGKKWYKMTREVRTIIMGEIRNKIAERYTQAANELPFLLLAKPIEDFSQMMDACEEKLVKFGPHALKYWIDNPYQEDI